MSLLDTFRYILSDRNWYAKGDKSSICAICNVDAFRIEEQDQLKDAYRYVHDQQVLFILRRMSPVVGKDLLKHFSSKEVDPKGPPRDNILTNIIPNAESVYFEIDQKNGTTQRNLLMVRNAGLEIVSLDLTESQMVSLAQHLLESKMI